MSKAKVQNVILSLRAKMYGFSAIGGATGALSKLNKTFGGLKSMLAGAGITGGLVSTIKAAGDFEKQMSRVSTMLSANDMSWMKDYRQGISDLAVKFGESTEILSSGLYDILSASVPPKDALELLQVAAEAAKGGFTDTSIAVDGLTSALNAYGKGADFAGTMSDKMAMTVKRGKLTFADLANNIGKVAPAAKAAGENMNVMFGMISALTRQGINTENSATQIVAMIRTAAKSGTDLMGLIKRFEGKSFSDILAGGVDELAARGIAALSGNVKDLQADIDAMANSGGMRLEAFGKAQDTFASRWDRLSESINRVKRSFGEGLMPTAEKVLLWAGRMSEKLNTLSERDYANLANKVLFAGESMLGLWASAKIAGGIVTAIKLTKDLTIGYKALKIAIAGTQIASFVRQLGLVKGVAAGVQFQFREIARNWRGLAAGVGTGVIAAGLGLIIQQAMKAAAALDDLQNASMNTASMNEKEKELTQKLNNASDNEEKLKYAYRLKDVRERLIELNKQEMQSQKDALDAGKFLTTGGYEAAEKTISNTQKVIDLKRRQVDEAEELIDRLEKLQKKQQEITSELPGTQGPEVAKPLPQAMPQISTPRRQAEMMPIADRTGEIETLENILKAINELIRVVKAKPSAVIGR